MDGVDDLVKIAAGQVGAADASGKERVACDEKLERNKVQADRTLGMPGGVQDLRRVASRPTVAPSARVPSGGAVSGVGTPSHSACSFIIWSRGRSFSFRKMGAPVSRFNLSAPPTWSIWAWVTRICFNLRPSSVRRLWIRSTSSPGSMTMASRACSSPRRVQLQASWPTGKDSKIMDIIVVCRVRDRWGAVPICQGCARRFTGYALSLDSQFRSARDSDLSPNPAIGFLHPLAQRA